MPNYFEPAANLHPFTVELVEQELSRCNNADLSSAVSRCEFAVLHDNGEHLRRDDGGYVGDSHLSELDCV